MHPRADELRAALALEPHPEGGWFRETHRSSATVTPADGRGERSALTIIWFLLTSDDISHWHRVRSHEVWQFCDGDPLILFQADGTFETVAEHRLGPLDATAQPTHVVPANAWQAARTTGAFTLASCVVAPGFEFDDFAMLRDDPSLAEDFRRRHPALSSLV
jgi:predicted cupin superfamily sugar epimerase